MFVAAYPGKRGRFWLLTTAAISAPVLWLMQASTSEDKKKKKVLAAVLTRSYRKTQKVNIRLQMCISALFHEGGGGQLMQSNAWNETTTVDECVCQFYLRIVTHN